MNRKEARNPRERDLLAVAVGLGACKVGVLSDAEKTLIDRLPPVLPTLIRQYQNEISAERDPLGEEFCSQWSAQQRRPQGATYTPAGIVEAMMSWARNHSRPARVVDPGAGSGRFVVAAGRMFPKARLVAVEFDPVAALLCRGHLAAAGLSERAEVLVEDYRRVVLAPLEAGRETLFIGNPPYVRHHLIEPAWKNWLVREAKKMGLHPSALAGLHVYFFLATAQKARPGDAACLITSSEWLDVNYGRMLRELVLKNLPVERLVILEPQTRPFPDAQTTAAIACLKSGSRPKSIFVRRVGDCADLDALAGGHPVRRERFETEGRWSHLTRRAKSAPAGYIELGEVCRVHRGQVTGANDIWIAGEHSRNLPRSVLFSTVTRGRELYSAGPELTTEQGLKQVIDLPADLDELPHDERVCVETFLRYARSRGAHESYIASHRKPWWAVGLRQPAPLLATYMARRPPAFVRNKPGVRHINIAHGLYPLEPMSEMLLTKLADYLRRNISLGDGRTYAGGLTKFEPREMERLLIPEPALLLSGETP